MNSKTLHFFFLGTSEQLSLVAEAEVLLRNR
jgi:hypothetical protein